jgi:hypothetical protein
MLMGGRGATEDGYIGSKLVAPSALARKRTMAVQGVEGGDLAPRPF